MQVTQKNRPIQVTTPLGEDVMLFYRMNGIERLGEPFEYQLELLSTRDAIKADDLLGENVTVYVDLPDGGKRHFNGYVTRFGQYGIKGNLALYRATVRPWLWFLTRAANCRIFQHKTVPDIIKQVFGDQGFSDFKEKLSGSYSPREYCVQYRESDFNFVSRLMEEEGIYYYFSHTSGKHDLVLSDSVSAHDKVPGYEKIPYHQEEDLADRTRADHIYEWEVASEVQSGVYALTDYDFKKPKAGLLVKSSVTRQHSHSKYEWFDYPGEYVEMSVGEHLVRQRIEELHAQYECCVGKGNTRGLAVGSLFTLAEHPIQKLNREHLVVYASYRLCLDEYLSSIAPSASEMTFECSFMAMDRTEPFRPPRVTRRPNVGGPQTAIVVGPSGEEIYVDKYGRVKVQFHWDRFGSNDENSSCWVRVSHPLAGKQWGMIAHPRIGQEVIVDFLEGDADQPIITGRVYNADQMPPYDLPANMTQSGIKSRSSKGGGTDNFNEIRFEDKKGSEEMYIHAEKDQNTVVEHDQTIAVGNDRKEDIKRDRSLTVSRDKFETVERNKTTKILGYHDEQVIGNMSVKVASNLTEMVAINYAETVGATMELTVGAALTVTVGAAMVETVGANRVQTVGSTNSINVGNQMSVDVGKNLSESIGECRTIEIGKDLTETIEGKHQETTKKEYMLTAKKILISAEDEISIKTGQAEIVMKKNGDITVTGGKINLKASGDMTLKGSTIKEN